MLKKILYDIQNNIFNIIILVSYVSYAFIALGMFSTSPKYLETLDYYVKIYISLFLLWRFNPFTKIKFTDLDRKIAFSAGLFIFTTTAVNKILISYFKEIKQLLRI